MLGVLLALSIVGVFSGCAAVGPVASPATYARVPKEPSGPADMTMSGVEVAIGHLKGEVALQEGDHAKALQELAAAAELYPGVARLHQRLAALYLRRGDLAQARESAKKAVASVDPNDIGANASRRHLLGMGKYDEAQKAYDKVIATSPDTSEAYLFLAAFSSKSGATPRDRPSSG